MSSDEDSSSGSDNEQPEVPPNPQPANTFKNDGSFMEMFRKMQEQQKPTEKEPKKEESAETGKASGSSVMRPSVTKRRGRVLPTGIVKKQKKDAAPPSKSSGDSKNKKDPWTQYMDEVKRYKQQSCSEEDGTKRPLVK